MDGEGEFDRKLSLSRPSPSSNSRGGDATRDDTPDFTSYVACYCRGGSGRAGRSRRPGDVRVGSLGSRAGEEVVV